jgi:WD40 repeat protein
MGGMLRIWNIETGETTHVFEIGHVSYLAISLQVLLNGDLVTADEHTLKIWKDRRCVRTLHVEHQIDTIVICPTTGRLMSCGAHSGDTGFSIALWDLPKYLPDLPPVAIDEFDEKKDDAACFLM